MEERERTGVQVLDDNELALQLRDGQTEAMEALFDRYGSLAYGLAYRMLSDVGAAEDVVQDAFLLVWRNARAFDADKGNLRGWLLTIVRNRAIDRLRRTRGTQQSSLELQQPEANSPDVWQTVSTELTRQDVREALSRLPEAQRQTLELAYFGGFTHSEIAQKLNVPLGTVKGRMRIGLEKVRSFLQGRGIEE
jgi:RNA polymerase sigma-70 factor (ECF subfamily)